MNRNYILLTLLMLALAFGTVFLKKDVEPNQIPPEELLQEIIQPTRYVTTDQVAKMIIETDPSLVLIDVRHEEEFMEYSLPRSVNIPTDSLMSPGNLMFFGIPGTQVVFFSNDDIKADQTWVLTKRLGYDGIYVMKGGLNLWIETIIDPQYPGVDAPYANLELYSFRKGAQLFFTGAATEENETSKIDVQVRRREKTNIAAGGC